MNSNFISHFAGRGIKLIRYYVLDEDYPDNVEPPYKYSRPIDQNYIIHDKETWFSKSWPEQKWTSTKQ